MLMSPSFHFVPLISIGSRRAKLALSLLTAATLALRWPTLWFKPTVDIIEQAASAAPRRAYGFVHSRVGVSGRVGTVEYMGGNYAKSARSL